jgi:hypothetical protein
VPRAEGGVGRRAGADAEGGPRTGAVRVWRDVAAQGALPRFQIAGALFESNLLQIFE